MYLPFSLFLGLRFNRSKNKNNFVSFISISSIAGIAFGVAVIIVGLAAMNGFERELQQRVLGVVAHGELQAGDGELQNWQSVLKKVAANREVINAAPYVQFVALAEKGNSLQAVGVRGLNPNDFNKNDYLLPQYISKNAWDTLKAGEQQAIIGQGVAKNLKIKVGDWITLMIPNLKGEQKIAAPRRVRVKITGLINLGGQIDHNLIVIPLADAQQYSNLGTAVSGIELRVKDVFRAQVVVSEIAMQLPNYISIYSWQQKFGNLYRDIQMIRTIMYIIMVLVIAIACFNIVSTLMMAVKDKACDIAVLRSMGASRLQIKKIFMWQGLTVGLIGSLIGVLIGSVLAINLTRIIKLVENIIGYNFLSGDIYFINFLPSQLQLQDILVVSSTAIFLSLLATFYPARRASLLNPAAVLTEK